MLNVDKNMAIRELYQGKPATPGRTRRAMRNNVSRLGNFLNFEKKDLRELPKKHPKYATAEVLILKDNNLTELNASDLPRNLKILDVRNNKIASITGEYPKTLERLWLDDNKLREVPIVPQHVQIVSTDGNPIKVENLMEKELEGFTDRSLVWMTSDGLQPLFNEEDFKIPDLHFRFYSGAAFGATKNAGKEFMEDSICRGTISRGYLHSSVERAEHMILDVVGGKIKAVAVFNYNTNDIHVALLCSASDNRGGGSRILKALKDYFHNHPYLDHISLDSVPEAKGFYDKMGFTRCLKDQLCPMEYRRKPSAGGGRTRRGRRNSKK